jgi:hypothetical protein
VSPEQTLDDAHRQAAGALGAMALALAGRRYTRAALTAWAKALRTSAQLLEGLAGGT